MDGTCPAIEVHVDLEWPGHTRPLMDWRKMGISWSIMAHNGKWSSWKHPWLAGMDKSDRYGGSKTGRHCTGSQSSRSILVGTLPELLLGHYKTCLVFLLT